MITFDLSSRTFEKILVISSEIGYHPSCVVLHDKIHIFNGTLNKKHFIYTPQTNTIESTKDEISNIKNMKHVALLNYKDKLLRFGGYDSTSQTQKMFVMSDYIKEDKQQDIEWQSKKNHKNYQRQWQNLDM